MPGWLNESAWRALLEGRTCPICRDGPQNVIAEMQTSWVTAGRRAPLPGYAAVVYKRHVVEPFELKQRDRAAFWEDVMTAAEILAGLFEPVKMNYEIHGNTIPHLHVHLFPRTKDDPFVDRPIDARKLVFNRSADDLERLARAFRERATPL